ncbi:MAG: hypothetical protein AB7S49_09765 [Arcobacter sp.]|jgi:hypothetical protein|nr:MULTISPECIES: hypothetical protein [Arcobacter]
MHIKSISNKEDIMRVQEEIKKELLKEIYGNIDNIYDFIEARYKLDKPCNDAVIKKLNELKDIIYKVSNLSDLS